MASSSRPHTSDIDDDRNVPLADTKPKPRDAFESAARSAAADRHADESLRLFAANSNAPATAPAPSRRDDVLYLGMNTDSAGTGRPQADAEASALARFTHGHSTKIETKNGSIIEHAGAKFDVSQPSGCFAFAQSLGLDAPRTALVASALTLNPPGKGTTELALLAKAWSAAEHGEAIAARFVLSGHCSIGGVYDGKKPGDFIAYESVQNLARAMPRAAAQIEDVMLSACSSGKPDDVQAWRAAFPNLKSLWAYDGVDFHSPSGVTAVEHIRVWEQATRSDRVPLAKDQAGPATASGASAARIHGLPMHANISTWTDVGGYRHAM